MGGRASEGMERIPGQDRTCSHFSAHLDVTSSSPLHLLFRRKCRLPGPPSLIEGQGSIGMWRERLKKLVRQEDGPTAVEYAVMLALILVVIFVAVIALGTTTNRTFNHPTLSSAMGT